MVQCISVFRYFDALVFRCFGISIFSLPIGLVVCIEELPLDMVLYEHRWQERYFIRGGRHETEATAFQKVLCRYAKTSNCPPQSPWYELERTRAQGQRSAVAVLKISNAAVLVWAHGAGYSYSKR